MILVGFCDNCHVTLEDNQIYYVEDAVSFRDLFDKQELLQLSCLIFPPFAVAYALTKELAARLSTGQVQSPLATADQALLDNSPHTKERSTLLHPGSSHQIAPAR